jgi:RNA polymerase sigma factor (sigma-70 family)
MSPSIKTLSQHEQLNTSVGIDLLACRPSKKRFKERVEELSLSSSLEEKLIFTCTGITRTPKLLQGTILLSDLDEKELATEVLRYRHRFTECLFSSQKFKQAALSVVQNIYLFQNRKIFFCSTTQSGEQDRQRALLLFSSPPSLTTVPLALTLQHLLIARIWNRIITQCDAKDFDENPRLISLADIVEKLNTLRNCYVLLSLNLIKKLAREILKPLYLKSITYEDVIQIGSLGVARAAYRYHPTRGIRFSTYAGNWIRREIQKEALSSRLVKFSANILEGYSRAIKRDNIRMADKYSRIIATSNEAEEVNSDQSHVQQDFCSAIDQVPPHEAYERSQRTAFLQNVIDSTLSTKAGDIIRRRFGLPPYAGLEQSVLSISKTFNVTRSSIYQIEQSALRKLRGRLKELSESES